MIRIGIATAILAIASLSPAGVRAQSRELSWPAIHVSARLDADGRLHVREQQHMRFTGDWNGGERVFNLRHGQELSLTRMTRADANSSAERELTQGDLSNIDEFDWASRTTLRWRSRLPLDPPFRDARITYTLEYILSNILVPRENDSFVLDHDFAFADRQGMIDSLTVQLTLDPAWSAGPTFGGKYETTALPPGDGYVVTIPLQYLGAAEPAGIRFGADESTRDAILALFLVGVLLLLARLAVREQRLGRFAPLPAAHEITPAFLEEHIFSRLPEVVGAAWDDTTSAPEVAATLARLVGEKKLSSRVEEKKVWIFKQSVLHLALEVRRGQFTEHERFLIDGLFRGHETETDTERVRKRYEKSGFDPAALIRKRLEKLVEDTTSGRSGEKPSIRLTLLLLAAGALIMAWSATQDPLDGLGGAITAGVSLVVYLVAVSQAAFWRSRVSRVGSHTLLFLVPLALGALGYSRVLSQGRFEMGALMLTGLTLWLLGLVSSICNQARSRQSAERIALRKRLAAARAYFRDELAKPSPQLSDTWFPYLIAFGLGRHIDKWFRAFGSSASTPAMASSALAGSSSSSGGSSSWTGFGGGGGFSGAGSTASFAAAVGGIAASVPSPSSSSSGAGGGGGGGGSSGGGGGGGW